MEDDLVEHGTRETSFAKSLVLNFKAISYLLPPTDTEEYYMVTVRITRHIFEDNSLFPKNVF